MDKKLNPSEVTKLKNKIRELEAKLSLYDNLCHSLLEAVIVSDFKGNVLFANQTALKMFGFKSPKEIKGLKTLSFIAPSHKAQVIKDYLNVLRGKEGYFAEYKVRKKTGEEFWVQSVGRKIDFEGKKAVLTTLRDITDLKRAQEKYYQLYHSLRDGIVMTNMKGKILECNQTYLDMLGYRESEIKNLTYQKLTPKKWHKMEAEIVKNQILKKGYSEVYEKEYIRKDGTSFPVELRTWLIKDEKGKPVGMWAIIRDISERKAAEERYRLLVETFPDAVSMTDLKGRFTFVSPQTLKLHGFQNPQELIGKSSFKLIAPKDRPKAERNLKKTLQRGRVKNVEYTLLRKDGTSFPAELNASLIKDEQGKPLGFVATVRDITERKVAERRLKERLKQEEKMTELMVGRELEMVKLKKRIKQLESKLKRQKSL